MRRLHARLSRGDAARWPLRSTGDARTVQGGQVKVALSILHALVIVGYVCVGSWLFGFWSTIGEIQASRLDVVPACVPPTVDREMKV